MRSPSVWKAEASPASIQNSSPPRARKRTEELHAALNNFRLSTWKSRQKLASAYPESLKSLGRNFVKLCNKTKMSRKCLENIFNLHILLRFHKYFCQVQTLRAFKIGDKRGINKDVRSLPAKTSRGRSHSQAKNSEVEYKWRELKSKVLL